MLPIWHEICRTLRYPDGILTRHTWINLSKTTSELKNQLALEGGWSFGEVHASSGVEDLQASV